MRRPWWRRVLRWLAFASLALVIALGLGWLGSADVRYLMRAGFEEALILADRRAIVKVAADTSTPASVRAKLVLVLGAQAFAADSLGLAAGRAYTTYARVRRDTLVVVLSASRFDRLSPYTWNYPIVGRVPYKGFFSFEAAGRETRKLERLGMDTYLRVASAFSTLGWFEDPLLSTVVREDSVELVATVIHEIFHNTLFVPGQAPFNESLANFVGHRGAEAFFLARGDQRNADRAAAGWRDQLRLGRFYANLAEQLERIYGAGLGAVQLREQRLLAFRQAAAQLAGPLGQQLETIDGRRLAERPLNNAVVVAARVYLTRLEEFERILAEQGSDLRATVGAIRVRVSGRADPWAALQSPIPNP